MLSRNFDNIVGEKDNSQKSLGYEIESWNDFANVLTWDSELPIWCPSSMQSLFPQEQGLARPATTWSQQCGPRRAQGPKCCASRRFYNQCNAVLDLEVGSERPGILDSQTLCTCCAVFMKNRCILLDHQVKPAMLRTVYILSLEPLHTSECRWVFLGQGTCWLICTLTRGKVEQWFVRHKCYQFCKRNTINTKRSGVIQSSEGLNWLSILIIRSEMVFPETRCINKSPWCSFPAFLQGKSPGSAWVGGPLIALNSAAVLWVRCSLCWPKHHSLSLLPLMILTKMRFRLFSTVPFFNTQSFCTGTRFGPWRAQGPKCYASRRAYN